MQDEEPAACAIREVYEETGLDISGRLVEGDYIETAMGQQSIRLYIITGISMDTPFAARVKGVRA